MESQDKQENGNNIRAIYSHDKIVPKFCNAINVALLNNKRNVVLTMLFNEVGAQDVDDTSAMLIDRIIIDISHAASMRDILNKILEDAGYVQDTE